MHGTKRVTIMLGALVATAGFVAPLIVPAQATETSDSAGETHQPPTPAPETQRLSASGQDAPSLARDTFTATTQAELEEQRRLEAERAAQQLRADDASTQWVSSSVQANGDSYPWWDAPVGVLSPLRYEYRECVDYVAWRLNEVSGGGFSYGDNLPGGSAWKWESLWSYGSGHTAVAGSVAWFDYNHVAYVQSVNDDGTVHLQEYNYGNPGHQYGERTVSANAVDLYLYPPGVN